MTFLKTLWTEESGASAAEYALILAIVGSAIVGGALYLGGTIAGEMNEAAAKVEGAVQ